MIQPPLKFGGKRTRERSEAEVALDKSGWTVRSLAKYLGEHYPNLSIAHVNLWKRTKGERDWGTDDLCVTCEMITGVKFPKTSPLKRKNEGVNCQATMGNGYRSWV